MSEAIVVEELERRCGWRKAGGIYAVNPQMSTGGVPVDCSYVLLPQPIPIPADFGSRRGYAYVDGQAILGGRQSIFWQLSPTAAAANAWMWSEWGMNLHQRADLGFCRGCTLDGLGGDPTVRAIQERLGQLWPIPKLARDTAPLLAIEASHLREDVMGECATVPLVSILDGLYAQAQSMDLAGDRLLASAWQAVHALRWEFYNPGEILRHLGSMMIAAGAVDDAAFLRDGWDHLRERLGNHRMVPDLLDWVGRTYYDTDLEFLEEADQLGISRRMPTMPRAAAPGVSRIFLAHPNCTLAGGRPAIFGYYYLAQVQYVVAQPDEPAPQDLLAAGVTPVCPQAAPEPVSVEAF